MLKSQGGWTAYGLSFFEFEYGSAVLVVFEVSWPMYCHVCQNVAVFP